MGKKSRRRKKDRIKKTKFTQSGKLTSANSKRVWMNLVTREDEEEVEDTEHHGGDQ